MQTQSNTDRQGYEGMTDEDASEDVKRRRESVDVIIQQADEINFWRKLAFHNFSFGKTKNEGFE